ncbi:hypothetical protein [Sphingomonas sp.]|uniref:hypothetical protein n=1 Tax=Sphingomonas sp. TaxID=28214 RepID=UPI003AFFF5D1
MRSVTLAALALISPSALVAQVLDASLPAPARAQFLTMPSPKSIAADKSYHERIFQIRAQALQQKTADGGVLTPEHLASIQSDLDRVNDRYLEQLRRLDPTSASADGRAAGFFERCSR